MIGTVKLNDVDPPTWLADALGRIAETPQKRLEGLLPWSGVPAEVEAAPRRTGAPGFRSSPGEAALDALPELSLTS